MSKEPNNEVKNEILNDAFWLTYILEIKKNIDDNNQKEVLSSFLTFFAAIFAQSTIDAGIGGLSGKRPVTLANIKSYRMRNLKYCASETSDTTKDVISDMEIDFNNYVFDLALYINKDELLDINFRNWDLYNTENFDLIDGVVASPPKWVEILMTKDFIEDFNKQTKLLTEYYAFLFKSEKIERKTYSSWSLLKNSKIMNDDKIYILQRYGLVKNIIFLSKLMSEDISFSVGEFNFSFKNFITKCKAIIIELFWEDVKGTNSQIHKSIVDLNATYIDDINFFKVNRKCRNNFHYEKSDTLTAKEMELLTKYQDIYLNNALSIFDSNLTYEFGISYKIGILIANLRYWSKL